MPNKLFLGEHKINLTDKNRIVIPVDFRRIFENQNKKEKNINNFSTFSNPEIIGSFINENYIEFYPKTYLYDLINEINKISLLHKDFINYQRALFSQSQKFSLDSQGRITLSKPLLNHIGSSGKTGTSLYMIGVGKYFELWNEKIWKIKSKNLKQEFTSITERIAYLIDKQS